MRIADLMGTGVGANPVPYDQSQGGDADVLAGAQAAGQAVTPAADPSMGGPPSLGGVMGDPGQQDMPPVDPGAGGMEGQPGAQPPVDAGGMGADPAAGTTDQLSDTDLASMEGPQGPDMEQILSDPNLSPEDRAAIEQQILMAARRQIAGV